MTANGSTRNPKALRQSIRVLVVDDHAAVRKGLIDCLNLQKGLVVIGEAQDGMEALAKARELVPDLVLMDIDMPKLDGLSATEILHRENPSIKVIILTAHSPLQYSSRILQSGAAGFLSKRVSLEELVQAIEGVALGSCHLNSVIIQSALKGLTESPDNRTRHQQLSPRERDVIAALTEGLSNKQVASKLDVSTRTVETHRDRIMRKLGLRGMAELTRFALANGLASLEQSSTSIPGQRSVSAWGN